MKEDFRMIFETRLTFASGKNRIQKWLRHVELFYPEVIRTIRKHLDGICHDFINRTKAWSHGEN